MKRPAWVRKSGPYKCESWPTGYIEVKPSWGQYGTVWNEADGGGPGFSGRMALADDRENWLNSCYTPGELAEGRQRIAEHDANVRARDNETTPGIVLEYVRMKAALERIVSESIVGNERSRNRVRCFWCGTGAKKGETMDHMKDCPVAIAERALRGE